MNTMNDSDGVHREEPKSWFSDAKLGIMITWGLYSVPGWAPMDPRLAQSLGGEVTGDGGAFGHLSPTSTTSYSEWYLNSMSMVGTPTWFYHQALYGGAPYDDFRTEFERSANAADFTPWVDLTVAAGARYMIPLTKHHDGYLLYPSSVPSPFKPGFHLDRDVIGEVASLARARGIRFGAYYSGGIDWTAAGLPVQRAEQITDENRAQLTRRFWPTPYGAYADAHYREIIDRYEPDILWNDIGYPEDARASELFEYYYGRVPHGVVNDRFMEQHHDFRTPEYHEFSEIQEEPWEMARGVGLSFGFNRQETAEQTLSGDELVGLLMRVVARNGNLLLGIGPDASGVVSESQRRSLTDLGTWLAVNGEAIYSTRPWRPEGDSGDGVNWTANGSARYALIERPGSHRIVLDPSLSPASAVALGPGVEVESPPSDPGVLVVRNVSGPAAVRLSTR
jgi:alpha-L-fucosidase